MVRATNVKRGRLVSDGLIRIKREAIPESRNPYLCAGEIIVVRSGAYTGDVAMVTHDWAGSVVGYDFGFFIERTSRSCILRSSLAERPYTVILSW